MDRQAYVEQLLDHYENPRNSGALPDASVVTQGGNPECGDTLTLYVRVHHPSERIEKVQFKGEGCTISQASASMLTEMVEGLMLAEVEMMTSEALLEVLGREVVASRPRCALLSLDTLKAAVRQYRAKQRAVQAAAV